VTESQLFWPTSMSPESLPLPAGRATDTISGLNTLIATTIAHFCFWKDKCR